MPLRNYTRAEMIVTERRRFERPLLAMVWVGIATLSLVERNAFYLGAATLAVLVNLIAVGKNREVFLSRPLVSGAVLLSSGILLAELFPANVNPLTALGHYLILIQLCKLFEKKGNRDYVQILALSGLVMVSASLQSEALWFAVALVIYLVLACYTTMVFTLKRGLDTAAAARLATEKGPLAPHQVAWNVTRVWPAKSLRRYAALVLIVVIMLGTGLFLLIPRGDQSGSKLFGHGKQNATVGIPGTVKLGQTGIVSLSERVVMTVKNRSPRVSGYLRGKVFYRYKDSRWSGNGMIGRNRREKNSTDSVPSDALVQEITMVPELLPTLFVGRRPLYVESSYGTVNRSSDGFSMMVRNWPNRPIRYRAYLDSNPAGPVNPEFTEDVPVWQILNQTIDVTPKVQKLAEKWCKDLLEQREKEQTRHIDLRIASRIARNLRKNYSYSLKLSDADSDRDGVEDFLFHMKKGHCEYFASALTVMCRSLDVCARLSTGFYVEQASQGEYQVRQRDAHAWTEVYTQESGWVIFDATPAAPDDMDRSFLSRMMGFWESVKFFWYDNILGYDASTREKVGAWFSAMFENVKKLAKETWKWIWDFFVKLLVEGRVDLMFRTLAILTGLLGLFIELLLLKRILQRLGWLPTRRETGSWREFLFSRKLVRLLQKHGSPCPAEQPLRKWAVQTAADMNLPAQTVRELMDFYYRLRWGQINASRSEFRSANQNVKQLSKLLSSRKRT